MTKSDDSGGGKRSQVRNRWKMVVVFGFMAMVLGSIVAVTLWLAARVERAAKARA